MRISVLPLAILGVVLIGVVGVAAQGPLLGFPGDRTEQQRALEARFDAELRADNLRQWMKRLTKRPHPCRLALREGGRRVSGRAVSRLGLRHGDRGISRPLPHPPPFSAVGNGQPTSVRRDP